MKTLLEGLFAESEIGVMSYDIFHKYGLDKIKDSLTENYDIKDYDSAKWNEVKSKSVMDSDGFYTDYTWYTDGTTHIFMFGDKDLYEPDEDYADWVCDSEEVASEWFDSYTGFESDDWDNFEEDEIVDDYSGNADFMNDGFDRVYGNGTELED